ncbi:MAG: autophagy-related protein 17 [Bacteroidota bacterium]|nr:autophagy-related protein 17 [Bacteroidota bacterium]
MDENKIAQLIDDLLQNRITDQDREMLNELMSNDPELVKSVAEIKQVYQLLEHIYYKELRQKLKHYDKSVSGHSTLIQKLRSQWNRFAGKFFLSHNKSSRKNPDA